MRHAHFLVGVSLLVLAGSLGFSTLAQAGVFSIAPLTGDADSGVSGTTVYTHATNVIGAGVSVNGVPFEVGDNWGSYWTLSAPTTYTADSGTGNVGGNVGELLRQFRYNPANANATLTLTGLAPGETYVTTWYSKGWDPSGRVATITASDGGSIVFDQDVYGQNNGSLLQYTFTATGNSITYTFANGPASFHHYGFSNAWTSSTAPQWIPTGGGNWNNAANWTGGTVPNGVGASAALLPGAAGTSAGTVTLDMPVTLGSLYLSGPGYTLAGPNALTMQAGSGNALIHTLGSHTIAGSTALVLNSDTEVAVSGGRTLTLAAPVSGPGRLLKSGPGYLTIQGNSPGYSAGVNILSGPVMLQNSGGLGTGDVTVGNGANLLLWFNTGTDTLTNNFVLNGIGATDGKAAIYADGGGAGYGTYILAGSITLNATSNISGNNLNNVKITGQITGPGGLTKGGTRTDENGTLTLANPANDYAGDTTVVKGRLRLGASEVIPDGAGKGNVTVNSGTVLDLGSYNETINGLYGGGTVVFSGVPTGPVYFTTNAGSDVSGAKTYTHLLDFIADGSAATVNGVAFSAAGNSGSNWSLAGATASMNEAGGAASAPTFPDGANGTAMNQLFRDFYYNGNPATLTLTGLTPGVSYETRLYNRRWGGLRYQRFTFDEDGAGPASTVIGFDEDLSATPSYIGYRFTAMSDTLTVQTANLTGSGTYHFYGLTNEVAAASALPTFTVGFGDFSGTIAGPGKLVKQGTGQLRLTAASTYTGGTDINGGSIRIDNPAGVSTGDVNIAGGANLLLWWNTGSNTVANNFVLNGLGSVDGKDAIYADGGGGGYGTYLITGDITLNATSNIGGHDINNLDITGRITGPGGLTKGGTRTDENNTLTLFNAANDYAGDTTVTKGTLRLGAAGVIPDGAGKGNLAVAGGATFDVAGFDETVNGLSGGGTIANTRTVAGANTLTVGNNNGGGSFTGVIQNGALGSLALRKIGTAQIILGGANTYAGGTDIQAGSLRIDNASGLGTGAANVAAGAYLMTWAPAAMTVANPITLNGPSGNPSYPAISIDGGGGLVTLTGQITLNATSDVGLGGSSWNDARLAGTVTGPGGLVVDMDTASGTQTLSLSGNNDYQGGTQLTGGRIYLQSPTGLGTGPVTINSGNYVALWIAGSPTIANDFVLNGIGALRDGEQKDALYADGGGAYGSYTLSGTITLNATSNIGGHNVNHLNINGRITGPGGLTKGGTRGDENNILTLYNTANDYAGDTTVVQGTLRLGASGVIPDGPGKGNVMILAGKTLDLGGYSETINGLSGAGIVTNNRGAAGTNVLTAGANNATSGFSGVIQNGTNGVVGLTKTGAGTLTLTGANTYTGGTVIEQGTLRIADYTARYTFDGDTADFTGAHNGTLNGAASYAAGKFGQALDFTGSQWVSVPYAPEFGLNSFTISAWVNLNAEQGNGGILGTRFGGDTTFDYKVRAADVHGDIGNGSAWINTGIDIGAGDTGSNGQGGDLPLGQWYMLTYVFDNAAQQAQLYIDGDLKRTIAYSGTPLLMKAGQTLGIGQCSSGEFMNGRIDDVYVFGRALNAGEIATLLVDGGRATNVLDDASPVSISAGATLDLAGNSETIGPLAGLGYVTLGSGTLTVHSTADSTFGGSISGSGALVKIGAGTLDLTGASTYTGGTTVHEGGKLAVNNTAGSATGSGPVSITAGTLAGNGIIAGPVTVGDDLSAIDSYLSPGNSIGTLYTGALTLNSDAQFDVEIDTSIPAADKVVAGGDLTLNSPTLSLVDLGPDELVPLGTTLTIIDYDGTWNGGIFQGYADDSSFWFGANRFRIDYNAGPAGNDVVLSAVPEPASLVLLLLAAAGLAACRARRKAG